jgi:hypothetical protein
MSKSIKSLMALAVLCVSLVAGLAACDTVRDKVFGPAETADLRAYRAFLIYEGLATLAQPSEEFRNADRSARSAIESLRDVTFNGQDTTLALDQTRSALRLYAAALAAKDGISIVGLDLKTAVFKLATQAPKLGKEAIHVRRQMRALDQAGRDPTGDEWQELLSHVDQLHAQIQGD